MGIKLFQNFATFANKTTVIKIYLRYGINKTTSLVIYNKRLYVTENLKELETIQSFLFLDWQYYKYYLYRLGFYDLVTDTISFYILFKVSINIDL
jgi:hypothetical protein